MVAVGTGQALKNAQNCDGDVLFVHAKPAEEQFVADGFGVERFDVMYNDFVIVGPASDPAKVAGTERCGRGAAEDRRGEAPFASRGDDSGTHQKEMSLWQAAGVDPTAASGDWYRETGSGMGATLNTALGMDAYALTDRGTWISFENKGDLEVLVEGDEAMFNPYGVILVSPEHCPSVKAEAGQQFVDWITGEARPGGDRRLPAERPAAVLPERARARAEHGEAAGRRHGGSPAPLAIHRDHGHAMADRSARARRPGAGERDRDGC